MAASLLIKRCGCSSELAEAVLTALEVADVVGPSNGGKARAARVVALTDEARAGL